MTKPRSSSSSAPLFAIEDIVRRRYNPEAAGMVVAIVYRSGNAVSYLVSWADETEPHEHIQAELRLDEEFVEKAN